jgi:hypothetical protein
MKTVFINNFNILDYFKEWENTHPLEISDEEYNKIQEMPFDSLWKWNEELNSFELITNTSDSVLRLRRAQECFPYINRSQLWFNNLTKEQQDELIEWYKAWLDVTETLEIPNKPEWLK